MFRTTISNTPLTSDTANVLFKNIHGSSYRGDISFLSTLRALVAPRIGSEEELHLKFQRSGYTASSIGSVPVSSAVDVLCEYFNPNLKGTIYIHNFSHHEQDGNYACIELLKGNFCKKFAGWHRLEKVTEFYQKQFLTICFINPENKSVAIFVDNMDIRKMHYLQCSIFAFLPWYFDPKEGVTELEMELISSLREKTSEKYEEVIAKIAEKYDFRSIRIRQLLSGFETKYEKIECEEVKRKIADCRGSIEHLNNQIGEYLRRKNEFEIRLLGLENKIHNTTEDSEIMEYFLCNNKLVLFDVTDEKILFGVKTYIEYFDEDMAEAAIRNKNSYLYEIDDDYDLEDYIPEDSMEKLMRAIFIKQLLKIKVCAAYEFNLNGEVNARGHFEFSREFDDCMPNPHIDGYRCLGNYQTTINTLLVNRDYITAIEQCVASAKSLNFGDSTVMETFSATIHQINTDYNNRCIELPDGKVVTPAEAISWLEEQEGNDNE